jgi:hypothetical protein
VVPADASVFVPITLRQKRAPLSLRHAALARPVGARYQQAAAQQPAEAACGAAPRVGCAFLSSAHAPVFRCLCLLALLLRVRQALTRAHVAAAQDSIQNLRQYALTEEELVRRPGCAQAATFATCAARGFVS